MTAQFYNFALYIDILQKLTVKLCSSVRYLSWVSSCSLLNSANVFFRFSCLITRRHLHTRKDTKPYMRIAFPFPVMSYFSVKEIRCYRESGFLRHLQ